MDKIKDNWISVEKKPKEEGYLLIVLTDDVVYGYWDGENFQAFNMGLSRFINVNATHWQNLPQPPKE